MPIKKFSWAGCSFCVPADWNLSDYHFDKHISRVWMEDDYSIRLEYEWTDLKYRVDESKLRQRYTKSSNKLSENALEMQEVGNLPSGWYAFLYSMPENKVLITAFRLAPEKKYFCFVKLHFADEGKRKPLRILNQLASTFTLHKEEIIPWEFYDVSFAVGRKFQLVNTSFEAGRKLMVFQWHLRKLYLWRFSLANMLLKDKSSAAWCSDFLNSFKGIKGPLFFPEKDKTIGVKRKWRYPFGHFEEIGRQCFRYEIKCDYIREKNVIILIVYNYRSPADLKKIAPVRGY